MLWRALTTVFTRVEYATFSLLFAIVVILGTLLWPNIALVSYLWQSQNFAAAAKFRFIKELVLGSPESIGGLAVMLVIATAVLLSVVVSMGMYVSRHKRATVAGKGVFTATGSGTFAAFFGVGCAACGPLLLGGFSAAFGASAFLLLLPFHGAEFGIIALLLLAYAVYALAKVITTPLVCSV